MKPLLLIVDDEKTQREGLRAVLEDHYEVYIADSAASAIELLESDSFDVLLTDFRMPGEDGLKLIKRAKSLAQPPVCILIHCIAETEFNTPKPDKFHESAAAEYIVFSHTPQWRPLILQLSSGIVSWIVHAGGYMFVQDLCQKSGRHYPFNIGSA